HELDGQTLHGEQPGCKWKRYGRCELPGQLRIHLQNSGDARPVGIQFGGRHGFRQLLGGRRRTSVAHWEGPVSILGNCGSRKAPFFYKSGEGGVTAAPWTSGN